MSEFLAQECACNDNPGSIFLSAAGGIPSCESEVIADALLDKGPFGCPLSLPFSPFVLLGLAFCLTSLLSLVSQARSVPADFGLSCFKRTLLVSVSGFARSPAALGDAGKGARGGGGFAQSPCLPRPVPVDADPRIIRALQSEP